MDRVSNILGRIMLGIFFCVTAAAMLITAGVGLESRSYLITLIFGAAAAAAFLLIRKRIPAGRLRLTAAGARRTGAALAALCLAVQLAWVFAVPVEPFSDYETYWQCACALAFGRPIASTEYIAVYPHILGYSSFLSIFLRIFGENVMVGTVLNALLTSISALLVLAICRALMDDVSAISACLIWIFMPTKLMLGSLIFSEPLYTCLILLFMLCMIKLEAAQERLRASLPRGIAAGLALGLILRAINIVRPIAVILIIAYVLWLLFLRGGALRDRRLWAVWLLISLVMLGTYKLTGTAWDRHVETILGEEPASLPVYNIYVGFNEQTQGQWSAEDMDVLFAYKRGEGLSAGEAQQRMLPHLKERLGSGIDFARLFRSKLFAFMGNDELGGYTYRWTRPEAFVKICMVIDNAYYFTVLWLMLAGLGRLLRRRPCSTALLIPLFSLGLTLAHMLVEVSTRYHYSLIPLFIIMAAFAAADIPKTDIIKNEGGYIHDTETVHSYSVL